MLEGTADAGVVDAKGASCHKREVTLCPCGSTHAYEACCAPYLAGAEAPSAEALMRSRFTAFVRRDVHHLTRTLHPDADGYATARADLAATFKREGRRTVYRALSILDAREASDDSASDDLAEVLFRADIRRRGKDVSFIEASTFVRTPDGWRYLSGILRSVRDLRASGVDMSDLHLEAFKASKKSSRAMW